MKESAAHGKKIFILYMSHDKIILLVDKHMTQTNAHSVVS
jgi:hypothetical protein